ncbi:MAG: MFS transporter [Steroidobacteraceae bacterium]
MHAAENTATGARGATIETRVPARLDALAWGRFHWLVVLTLGITWVLDGLEVTLAGAVSAALRTSPSLQFSETQIGAVASAYLAGAVLGALYFGWLTDRLGRKRLFFVTLGIYLVATGATAFAWDFTSFAVFRFITGAGIGGEYAAINSAIQELIPARYRGRTDLAINGSFWLGAVIASATSHLLLEPGRLPEDMGWRAAFAVGAVLGLIVIFWRRFLPESPRWLLLHGRVREAEAIVSDIERRGRRVHEPQTLWRFRPGARIGLVALARTLFRLYPQRAALGLSLMAAQAFFYNAIFFTYALVLDRFFRVPPEDVGLYLIPFAISNFLGPLLLGPWFDRWSRRGMITLTYAVSGVLLAITAALFYAHALTAVSLTVAFAIVFFFASAAASSAYLTVSESFPLEVRALAIALFYALGTGLGGVAAPWFFGALVESGSVTSVVIGYLVGAVLMLLGAAAAFRWGVAAERKALEHVARPLSSVDA